MENFITENSFSRFFHPNDDFGIIHFGYDDFSFVKAAKFFREQNFYTWHFILSGKGHLEIGGKAYDLSEGDSFFIPPDTQMRYFPDPNDPWEYVWFSFKGERATRYAEELLFSIDVPTRPCRNFGRTKQLLKRTIEDMRDENYGYYKIMSVFYEIMDLSACEQRSRTPIESVRDCIDESYTMADFTIENLCRHVGFSHSQLLRLFKKKYGKTVQQYMIEKRISLACELLEKRDIPVRSVALSCGFSDEIHFMKTFKKHYGITATEYRKSVR